MINIVQLRERLEQRKLKAAHDAFNRDQRTKVLKILYHYWPKQEDNKIRTETIGTMADEIIEELCS